MFSLTDLEKLIAHEIETHIYCAENGNLQPYQILRRGTSNYLKTQEGLAIYNQDLVAAGGLRNALLNFHAVLWARELGFRAVFNRLSEYLSVEDAWKISVKVKRGLSDTGNRGAFVKNLLYYWGYLEIKDYLSQGGNFEDLFLGKFELSQLDLIKQIEGLKRPLYLPRSVENL